MTGFYLNVFTLKLDDELRGIKDIEYSVYHEQTVS